MSKRVGVSVRVRFLKRVMLRLGEVECDGQSDFVGNIEG